MITQRLYKDSRETTHNQAFIKVVTGPQTELIEVREFFTLGRDDSNMLCLNDDYVSTRHARIEKRGDGFYLRDLRSRNGTFLNGAQIMEAVLADGDRMRIGRSEIVFQHQKDSTNPKQLLISKNKAWAQQLDRLPSMAASELPVLILGPSGAGKELLARQTHELSGRSHGPFVSVNCSALSESLVESELFGHVKGSFTGSMHDRKGAFESARGGTLFLDEIGDLPLPLQPKLLRALENKEIKPVGSDRVIQTDVRVVAATHQNLMSKVAQKEFREDLFYRLNVIQITPPALKDRIEDFDTLLYGFAKHMRVRFSFPAIQQLKEYSWPGNIRELKNTVARAKALFDSREIRPEHVEQLIDLHKASQDAAPAHTLGGLPVIKEIERQMIIDRLIAHRGNQRQAAASLNMPKSTLHDRIRSYGINVSDLVRGSRA